jgi:hypothetical protein
VRLAGSKQLGPSVHQTRAGSSMGPPSLSSRPTLRARTRTTGTLRRAKGPDLIDVELVKVLAGSLLAWTMKFAASSIV